MGAILGIVEISKHYAHQLAAMERCGGVPLKLFPHSYRVTGGEMTGLELVIEHTAAVEAFDADSRSGKKSVPEVASDMTASRLAAAQHVITEHRLRKHGGIGVPGETNSVEQWAYLAALEFIAMHLTSSVVVKDS
jgi:hypothetical protein